MLEGGGIHLLGNLGIEGILLQLILPEMSDVFVLLARTFLICRFSLLFMLHRWSKCDLRCHNYDLCGVILFSQTISEGFGI